MRGSLLDSPAEAEDLPSQSLVDVSLVVQRRTYWSCQRPISLTFWTILTGMWTTESTSSVASMRLW